MKLREIMRMPVLTFTRAEPASDAIARMRDDFLQSEPLVGSPEMTATKAAFLVRQHRIGCLPLVEAGKLVGIVTRRELLEALATRRKRDRTRSITACETGVPRPPLVVCPNRDKWP